MIFNVILDRDEDGYWCVECPSIPGCISQGDTRDEALGNIKAAIELCLEVRSDLGMPLTVEVEQIEGDHGTLDHGFSGPGVRDERLQTRTVVEVAFRDDRS